MNRHPKKEMKELTNWKTSSLVMYKPELIGKERLIIFFFTAKFPLFSETGCASLCLHERAQIWAVTAECTEHNMCLRRTGYGSATLLILLTLVKLFSLYIGVIFFTFFNIQEGEKLRVFDIKASSVEGDILR